MPVIAEQIAGTFMDEDQVVAVGVAREARHLAAEAPVTEPHRAVVQDRRRVPWGVRQAVDLREIEGARAEITFPARPSRGRMAVIHLRGRAEEAILAQLSLIAAGRQVGVGLARSVPFALGKGDPVLHALLAPGFSTPRRT